MYILEKLKYIVDFFKLFVAKCISSLLKILNKDYRDIWLIGERKSEAKDNGYHLFKYIRLNHPNNKIYYTIDRGSSDLDKVKDLGNVIYHDSFKHYLYYAMSSKLICAHLGSCVPDSPVCWKFYDNDMKKKKKIFIQHGIIKERIPSLMYKNTKADLFVCGAKPEYEFVKNEFGYPGNSVRYLGLARFDNLHDRNEKNQILVMPTWRQWIPGATWSNNIQDCREIFFNSQYYKTFNNLINNYELINLLEKNNYELIFYPHFEMQGYIDLFKSKAKNIVIARKDDYDVQTLLKESKILVTDYSSVAFDFAYMRKPVIYYQFDSKKYYENHYQNGYFIYEEQGFGPVVELEGEVINSIKKYLYNRSYYGKYINKSEDMFCIYDKHNCNRHYSIIKNLN